MLVRNAKEFRADTECLSRNMHLHNAAELSGDQIDAVLVCFLNYVAAQQGVDLALHSSELSNGR